MCNELFQFILQIIFGSIANIIGTPILYHAEVADTATSKIKERVSLQEKAVIYQLLILCSTTTDLEIFGTLLGIFGVAFVRALCATLAF